MRGEHHAVGHDERVEARVLGRPGKGCEERGIAEGLGIAESHAGRLAIPGSTRSSSRRLTAPNRTGKPAEMPTAHNGDVEIYFETFGSPADPTLLLVNGIGSQCINYDERWCEKFAAHGYHVIRFDNRDMGLSSKLDDREYGLRDMAADALAVLDAVDVERART